MMQAFKEQFSDTWLKHMTSQGGFASCLLDLCHSLFPPLSINLHTLIELHEILNLASMDDLPISYIYTSEQLPLWLIYVMTVVLLLFLLC